MHSRSFVVVKALTGALIGAASVACTSLDSEDLRTNGMEPSMTVTSSAANPNSKLSVQIHVGDSLVDFVDLGDPDQLTMTVDGGNPQTLSESNLLGVFSYAADITGNEPGTEVVVALVRGPDDDGAPASTVTFTERLALTSPAAGAALSRATDDLVVTWTSDASTDPVRVSLSGECIQAASRDVQAGDLTVTFAAGSLLKKEDADPEDEAVVPDSCEMNVSVVRTHTGTLDGAFGGGSIQHQFSASATVTTNL